VKDRQSACMPTLLLALLLSFTLRFKYRSMLSLKQ
jgi:hypothetical protein